MCNSRWGQLGLILTYVLYIGCGRSPRSVEDLTRDSLLKNQSLFHESEPAPVSTLNRARGSHNSSNSGGSASSGGQTITPLYHTNQSGFDPSRVYSHYGYGHQVDRFLAYADYVKSQDYGAVSVGIVRFGPDQIARQSSTPMASARACWNFKIESTHADYELILDRVYQNAGGVGNISYCGGTIPPELCDPFPAQFRSVYVNRSTKERSRGGFTYYLRSKVGEIFCPYGYHQSDFNSFDPYAVGTYINGAYFLAPFCGPRHGTPTLRISDIKVMEEAACSSTPVTQSLIPFPQTIDLSSVVNSPGIPRTVVRDTSSRHLEIVAGAINFDGPGYLGEQSWYWDPGYQNYCVYNGASYRVGDSFYAGCNICNCVLTDQNTGRTSVVCTEIACY